MDIRAAVLRETNQPLLVETLDLGPPKAGELLVDLSEWASSKFDADGALGSGAKALHAGFAARVGVEAAALAEQGLFANPAVFRRVLRNARPLRRPVVAKPIVRATGSARTGVGPTTS